MHGSRSRAFGAWPGILLALVLLLGSTTAGAQESPGGIDLNRAAQNMLNPENVTSSIMIVFMITIISLAPAILVMTTSFTRIIVVLGFLRQAMATQQTPPNQILIGLSLILTFFIMTPTYQKINQNALQPYLNGTMDNTQALEEAIKPMRDFMFKQTRSKDIALFQRIAELPRPKTRDDVPITVLVPAFILSELTTAFMIGFIIYIPFLIIDMVVASTLMAMGMMMLPPIFVSLPFKIIMFVLADGWYLLFDTLTRSFK